MAPHVPKSVLMALALLAATVLVSFHAISHYRQYSLSEVSVRNPAGPKTQMRLNFQDSRHAQLYASEESAFPNCAIAWRSCDDKATDCMEVWRSAGLLKSWKTACLTSTSEAAK